MNPLRIVIIEDEPVTARNLAHILLSIDTNINIVDMLKGVNESIAWFTLNQTKYDLVLMDIQMPVVNGLEAAMAIRKLEGSVAEIPIIAMTAQSLNGEKNDCFENGMNGYVSKPFKTADLFDTIAEVLKHREKLSAT